MPSPHAAPGTAGDRARARTGWPLPVDDAATSFSLAPLLNNLPSLTGISEMSGINRFLPAKDRPRDDVSVSATWQAADLDGRGVARVLLLTSPAHALQVYAFRDGVIPDDQHVTEAFPPPEEVASIPEIKYASGAVRSALDGSAVSDKERDERVLCAHLLDAALWGDEGPIVGLITLSAGSNKATMGKLALVLVALRSGTATRRLELGKGNTAAVTSSRSAIVVSLSSSVHVLDSALAPLKEPYTSLPVHPTTSLPIVSLSGRLLAMATDEPAALPGAEGLGSIVVSSRPKEKPPTPAPNASPQSTQGAILSSAVEIGGGVARGVWAGIKMGARAANDARNNRLAQSAPSERSMHDSGTSSVSAAAGTPESRSVEDGMPSGSGHVRPQALWVKIIDVTTEALIAHFRLPPSRQLVPPLPSQARGGALSRDQPVSFMSFSPEGTRLFVAPADGRAFHVLDVRPHGAEPSKGPVRGQVWSQYVLRRGNTPATVSSVAWARDERWIAVGTGRGTIHVFAITPGGSKPSASSHVPLRIANAPSMSPLGVELSPVARLRPSGGPLASDSSVEPAEAEARINSLAFATFTATRRNPLSKGILCQDVAVYRSGLAQVDLVRLSARATASPTTNTRQPDTPARRRGSNLTEMLRERSGLVPDTDLGVESAVKARWALPLGQGKRDAPRLAPTPTATKPRANGHPTRPSRARYLAHAEIRTHSDNPRILPASIYLCHQADFFAAHPTDEYQPLSVLDKVARTKRLVFRPEVEISPPADPFDEPLNSALHSVLDSKPSPQLPRLPNGSPSKSPWGSVPIRHIAQNLGEGVDRMRREYARAQARSRRRGEKVGAGGTPLSFEDDTVFASVDGDEEGDDFSPPSSGPMPPTLGSGEGDLDDDWSERWEDEYRRAVEDDGGPDDLVLGLLDEEEEERRVKAGAAVAGGGGGGGGGVGGVAGGEVGGGGGGGLGVGAGNGGGTGASGAKKSKGKNGRGQK